MAGTTNRLCFFTYTDLSGTYFRYDPPLADYPEYPRKAGIEFFEDNYKSALGSNYWRYQKGESFYWEMDFTEVSEDAMATWGITVGTLRKYLPHVVIWEGPNWDGIGDGSLFAQTPVGTFFIETTTWEPQEVNFGLWNFTIRFRRES